MSSAMQVCEFIQETAIAKTMPKNRELTNLHNFFKLLKSLKKVEKRCKSLN